MLLYQTIRIIKRQICHYKRVPVTVMFLPVDLFSNVLYTMSASAPFTSGQSDVVSWVLSDYVGHSPPKKESVSPRKNVGPLLPLWRGCLSLWFLGFFLSGELIPWLMLSVPPRFHFISVSSCCCVNCTWESGVTGQWSYGSDRCAAAWIFGRPKIAFHVSW